MGGNLSSSGITIKMPGGSQNQQQQQQQPVGAQLLRMQNMRQPTSGTPTLHRQQTLIGLGDNGGQLGPAPPGPADQEQSALDYAQSAAARVTATGSAAAAMAAAKFKMLRSNTLAAAFGQRPAESGGGGGSEPGGSGMLGPGGGPAAAASNLIAVRTKDERVNTISSPSSRLSKFDFS